MKIVVARPTGNETVSFTKDIAPFMVERCLRCHSGNEPKGGLSLETFETLFTGGKSGAEIVPGNLDKSRLWASSASKNRSKCRPATRSSSGRTGTILRTWILEGAKYDGGDPKHPLRSLVPTASERRTAELARSSPQELHERRRQRSEELWRRAYPRKHRRRSRTTRFLFPATFRPNGSSRSPAGRPREYRRLRRSSTTMRQPRLKGAWPSS